MPNTPEIILSPVYDRLDDAIRNGFRFILSEGGTRSTKTYSHCQRFVQWAIEGVRWTFTIGRLKSTWLRDTAMRDFIQVLRDFGVYNENNHNKSERTYRLNGSLFQFVGFDEEQKLRGLKQHVLWVNEANEAEYESIRQLVLRTERFVFFDYNPTLMAGHWIDEKFIENPDRAAKCIVIRSSYQDAIGLETPDGRIINLIPQEIVQEIEHLRTEDPYSWAVYGLGQRGSSPDFIFSFVLVDDDKIGTPDCYGLDFGYVHPTVLTGVRFSERIATCDQVIHRSYLTTPQLIGLMGENNVSMTIPIYADHARPETIEEIRSAGYNIMPANKSVDEGIRSVQSYTLQYTKRSTASIKQMRAYKWRQTHSGKRLDSPVKFDDDAPDSVRYAIHSHAQRGEIAPARIRTIKRKI